jgi:hypothetical protein
MVELTAAQQSAKHRPRTNCANGTKATTLDLYPKKEMKQLAIVDFTNSTLGLL